MSRQKCTTFVNILQFKSLNSVYNKKGSTNLHSARLTGTKIIKTFPSQTIRAQRA